MTKDEILEKIAVLNQAAENLEEPDKTLKLSNLDQLKIELLGMAISEIADKMQSITLSDIEEMEANIKVAKDAAVANSDRVAAFNRAYNFIKGTIGIVL